MFSKKGLYGFAVVMLVMVFSSFVSANDMGIRSEGGIIFIENESVRYIVSGEGKSLSFFDKAGEKEYLDTERPCNFMTLKRGDKIIPSTAVLYDRGQLIVRFNPDWTTIKMNVEVRENYLVFEVVWTNSNDFDELQFCDLPLTIRENVGTIMNICRTEAFGVSLQALNYFTHCRTVETSPVRFVGSAYPEFDHVGTKLAVVTGPADEMLSIIGKLEQQQGLPHPTLDGVWGKISPDAEKSYLFVDYTEQNVDRAIEYAKKGGFKYLCMYLDTWAKTCGKYTINLENYPRGFESVVETVDKIHAAGLKSGAHTMSGSVYKFDEYVTPVPDKRLAKDGERILAADIGMDDEFIPTTESPEGLSLQSNYLSSGGMDLQIGDELITYAGYSTTKPYGFTGCRRGAHGTYAAGHKKSDTIYHMAERYNWYMAGGKTSMVEEIAESISGAINRCGFDWIYFDGAEALAGQGPYWYYVAKVLTAICNRFDREVLVQGSSMPHFNWHHFSRRATIDWVWLDQKGFVDWYSERSYKTWRETNIAPIELGWFGYFLDSHAGESSTPDEIEYLLSRCLAYDAAWSFETKMKTMDSHGRTDEILEISKNYETVRLSGYFSDTIRKKLRKKKSDFKLEPIGNKEWIISPVTYGPDKYVRKIDGKDNRWNYINPYAAQPLKVRLKARPEPAEYENHDNIVLVDSEDISKMKSSSVDPSFTLEISASREKVKSGETAVELSCDNSSDAVSNWAAKILRYDSPKNLTTNRALGFWVYGNSSGGALVIQLQDPTTVYVNSHVVSLDFSGWKYCEFLCPTGMEIEEYNLPGHKSISLRGYNYKSIQHIALIMTNIPPHTKAVCSVSPVKALKEYESIVSNPGLIVNGQKIIFPATLRTNDYLEFWGSGKATVFDPNGQTITEITPSGTVPILISGNNEIESLCNTAGGKSVHARVTIIAKGEPLTD